MSRRARSAARLAAVQALYQMDVASKGLTEILAEFEAFWIGQQIEGEQYERADFELFRDLVAGVLERQVEVDRMTDKALNVKWPLRRIEAVLRAILRSAAYELMVRRDVPARVVITEYVDVAAAFYGAEETNMVNAVLDHVARQQRASEFSERA